MGHGKSSFQVDRILLKHTLNMLVELGVQGKNVWHLVESMIWAVAVYLCHGGCW